MTNALTRRAFLTRSAILGCSAAASPLLTPVSLAAAPCRNDHLPRYTPLLTPVSLAAAPPCAKSPLLLYPLLTPVSLAAAPEEDPDMPTVAPLLTPVSLAAAPHGRWGRELSAPLLTPVSLAAAPKMDCIAYSKLPLLTPVSLAAAPWDNRLVVIVLRGGMDGLDVVQPYGDANLAGLRPGFAIGPAQGALDLDGFYAMHPSLAPLYPMWQRGDLGFVQAVSTPYRDKRSHFDGQDLLEAGTATLDGTRDGWLNRMLQAVPGVETTTAFALGHGEMKLLLGEAPVADWSPDANLLLSPQALRLAEMTMAEDPAFHAAFNEAVVLSEAESGLAAADDDAAKLGQMQGNMMRIAKGAGHVKIAEFAGKQLRKDARVVSFSLNGWDTHQGQTHSLGRALQRLSETILTLEKTLTGPVWKKTAVVAMTEFGRTVRTNGTKGTDHGTGGAMLLAGGAVRGGQVAGQWPGLDEADLYARRDLLPTDDVRCHAAWVMQAVTGLETPVFERAIFPGIEMGDNPGLVL